MGEGNQETDSGPNVHGFVNTVNKCKASRKRKTQCPVEGRVAIPMQQIPHGWPETAVLVRHEMPGKIRP